MALKPRYKVVTPREDLREGKPLDASEPYLRIHVLSDGVSIVSERPRCRACRLQHVLEPCNGMDICQLFAE